MRYGNFDNCSLSYNMQSCNIIFSDTFFYTIKAIAEDLVDDMKAPFCTVAKRRLSEKLFSIFEFGFKLANTLAEHRMKFVRTKFDKRIEDEITILHIDMRHA